MTRVWPDGFSNHRWLRWPLTINLQASEVDAVVRKLEEMAEKGASVLNEALVHAEQLCDRNGILDLATYDIAPLVVDARVHSKFGRHYLELICKVDQLMQILETLVIDEVMSNGEMAARKAKAKRTVRSLGSAIRLARFGLHKRINAMANRASVSSQGVATADRASPADDTARAGSVDAEASSDGAEEHDLNPMPESAVVE